MSKLLLFVLILLVSTSSLVNSQLRPSVELSDTEIRNFMIGSCVVPPDASDRITMGSISNYRKDGILEHKIFKTHKCKNLLMVLVADWVIENGKLHIKNTRTQKGNEVESMQHVIDRVIEISIDHILLQSERDKKIFHRVKNDSCLL